MPTQRFHYDTTATSGTPNFTSISNTLADDGSYSSMDDFITSITTPSEALRLYHKFDGSGANDSANGLPATATIDTVTFGIKDIYAPGATDLIRVDGPRFYKGSNQTQQADSDNLSAGLKTFTWSAAPSAWFTSGMTTGQDWIDVQDTMYLYFAVEWVSGMANDAKPTIDFIYLDITYTGGVLASATSPAYKRR